MTTWLSAVAIICVLTRITVDDHIFERPRLWLINKIQRGWFIYLIGCFRCTSIWIGTALTPAMALFTHLTWWQIAGAVAAGSYTAGTIADLTDARVGLSPDTNPDT